MTTFLAIIGGITLFIGFLFFAFVAGFLCLIWLSDER